MAKSKTLYICTSCGGESLKWNGKCPSCGEWNTLEETEITPMPSGKAGMARQISSASVKITPIGEVDITDEVRYHTGMAELDRVLGGGLVKGSLVLLGGDPGIGKSTLMLQICTYLGKGHSVLYVSGEESARQLKLRADRLNVQSENVYIAAATDAEQIAAAIIS